MTEDSKGSNAPTYNRESEEVQDFLRKGYSAITLDTKSLPPRGFTGGPGRVSTHEDFGSSGTNFIAIRHYDTFAIDIDTDDAAGHKVIPNPRLANVWREFLDKFSIEPVRTGANTANEAGIYHFNYGPGVTEDDIQRLSKIDGLDVLRRGHRYAVVRGIHANGNTYAGGLPDKSELPEFTREHLEHFEQYLPTLEPQTWKSVSDQAWQTAGTPCRVVANYVDTFIPSSNRHGSFMSAIYHLACLGAAGHNGVAQAIDSLAEQWSEYSDKTPNEFDRLTRIKRLPAQARIECSGSTCKTVLASETQASIQSALYPVYALEQNDTSVGKVLSWNGNAWEELTKIQYKGKVSERLANKRHLNSIFAAIEAEVSNRPVPAPEQGILHCRNGIVNLNTGEFEPHSADKVPGRLTGITYEPTATAPRFIGEYLPSFAPDEETQTWLLSFMKYMLQGGNVHEKFLIIKGKGGQGKGTFLDIVQNLAGDYSTALSGTALAHSSQDPDKPQPALARLHNRRIAITDELDEHISILNVATIKAMTGKSVMSVRDVYQSAQNIIFEGVLVISTNRKPNFRDDAEGIDRRVIFYEVPERKGAKDPTLKADIVNRELSGILNLIMAAPDWDGTLPPVVQRSTDAYINSMEVVKRFIEDHTEPVEDRIHGENLTALYDEFKSYIEEDRGGKPISQSNFKQALLEMGIDFARTQKGWAVAKLRLVDEPREQIEEVDCPICDSEHLAWGEHAEGCKNERNEAA